MKMEKENVGQGTKFSVHISLGPSKSFVEVTAPFGCDICILWLLGILGMSRVSRTLCYIVYE